MTFWKGGERLANVKVKKKRKRRRRRQKLRHLRRRLAETEDLTVRRRLIARIRRISPKAPVPEM
jgi:hypothetical protein